MDIKQELTRLKLLIKCDHCEVIDDTNTREGYTVWKLYGQPGRDGQVGQVEARFGSESNEEPNGFACYKEGFNWTDYLPTVEECVAQHKERKQY